MFDLFKIYGHLSLHNKLPKLKTPYIQRNITTNLAVKTHGFGLPRFCVLPRSLGGLPRRVNATKLPPEIEIKRNYKLIR